MSPWCHGGKKRRFQEGGVSCVRGCCEAQGTREGCLLGGAVTEENGGGERGGGGLRTGRWATLPPVKSWARVGRSPNPSSCATLPAHLLSPAVELTWWLLNPLAFRPHLLQQPLLPVTSLLQSSHVFVLKRKFSEPPFSQAENNDSAST